MPASGMVNLLLIFVAGGLGSLSRYGLGLLVNTVARGDFPYSTTLVNVLGCFLFGVVQGLAQERAVLSVQHGAILAVGFLGAFTTFSTFAFESELMIRKARWLPLVVYLLAQNVIGIAAVFLGLRLVR
jgi:CrcB protein